MERELKWLTFLLLCLSQLDQSVVVQGQHLACDNRRPEGHTPTKRDGDGGFRIILVGTHANRGLYSPNEVYTVTIQGLKTRYSTQKFTEFLLVAESEKQAMMGPTGLVTTGIFHIIDDTHTRFGDTCPDGVTSVNRQPKSEISVLWTAPSILVASCITFKATVVERPHMWYMDDGQLNKTVCPETNQKPKTTLAPPPPVTQRVRHFQSHNTLHTNSHHLLQTHPQERREPEVTVRSSSSGSGSAHIFPVESIPSGVSECCACDEAKYEVVFEGIWSKETHPKDFPENEWLLHFSDIIGASHSPEYYVWKKGQVASEGIRQVAEWGATRHLENELKANSRHINTIIKARGLWHPNEKGKTSAAFRVDKSHHLMSLVSMIGPSPDWIVGISALELCLKNCTWLEDTELDLFPYDAGTDSGITYMSPNTPTEPRGNIEALSATNPDDPRSPFYDAQGTSKIQPFAKVHIRRQRIYPKNCNDTSRTSETSHEVYLSENTEDVNRPECAVMDWTSWSACSVTCGKGLRMRKRNYVLPMKADMMRCDRQLIEKEMCLGDLPTCPPDEGNIIEEIDNFCAVSQWSDWKPCSAPCGQGTRTRQRHYKNRMGRKKCNMELIQTEACQGPLTNCDSGIHLNTVDPDCPLTPWSEWAPCSVSCGTGYQIRTRRFLPLDEEPLPQKCDRIQLSQRADCTGEYGAECRISMQEAKTICILPPETGPCRANKIRYFFSTDKLMCLPFAYGGCKGNRNRFERLDECNQICGFMAPKPNVTTTRRTTTTTTTTLAPSTSTTEREIPTEATTTTERVEVYSYPLTTETPPPSSGFESDEVLNLDLGASNYLTNTDNTVYSSSISPKWIPWTPEPTEASPYDLFTRMDTDDRVNEQIAEPLVQSTLHESLIDRPVIDPQEVEVPPKVDCVISPWSQWSPCSETCGTGYMTKTREILVQPQNDGRRCQRRLSKQKLCRLPPC